MQRDEQLVNANTELPENEGMVADSSSEAARSLSILRCKRQHATFGKVLCFDRTYGIEMDYSNSRKDVTT